jgi:tRNA 2-thiocytidine biosynthesis protein TtcA
LIYCAESELAALATELEFPIVPCDLCGSQDNLQRQRVKRLIGELAAENPNVRGNLFASLANVRPTHLIDRELSRALGLTEAVGKDAFLDGESTRTPLSAASLLRSVEPLS